MNRKQLFAAQHTVAQLLTALCLFVLAQHATAQVSFGESTRFNDGWLFMLEAAPTSVAATPPAVTSASAEPAHAETSPLPERPEAQSSYDDSRWRHLTLPHDWSAEGVMSPQLASCTGYLPGGVGWYRKHFKTPTQPSPTGEEDASVRVNTPSSTIEEATSTHLNTPSPVGEGRGGVLYLYFEGVYNRSEVYLNGHLLGCRPNGYASFLYDMTPYLNHDGEDNVLAVRVDHSRYADSRWYTGSGIYRDVWLISAPEVHLAQWGSAWRLKKITRSEATVEVDIATDGGGASPASSLQSKELAGESLLAEVVMTDASGREVARTKTKIGYPAKKTVTLNVKNPHRWSLDDTYLYNIETRLYSIEETLPPAPPYRAGSDMSLQMESQNAKSEERVSTPRPIGRGRWEGLPIDHSTMRAGLRTLQFSPDHGFALNGRWMKVKGVCLHHDAGVLGAVVPREVWQHRLEELKKIGVNAIRMAHNPQAPVVYDLCDELGLLVMDEASDEWEFPKRKWLEGWNRGTPGYDGTFDFFEEWIERDVADMVRRDRNHPSVFLWSIGNEVDYPNDPYSHPILDGDGKDFTQPMYGGYKPEQPNAERIGKIARRLSAVVRGIDNSRAVTGALAGVVMSNQTEYPEAIDVVGYNYTESRYKEDHATYPKRVIYGSENRHDYPSWLAVKDNEHIFGQFLWTGADYLGESGPWPARGSSAGLVDLASQRKPNGWYRASLWSEEPVVYIGTYPINNRRGGAASQRGRGRGGIPVSTYATDTWNYREGQQVRVVCYTNQPHVSLTLNGQPVGGEARLDSATSVRYWDIEYQPGTLRAEVATPQSSPTGKGASARAVPSSGEPKVAVPAKGAGEVAHVVPSSGEEGSGVVAKNGRDYYEIKTSGLPYALRIRQEPAAPLATAESSATCFILTIDVVDEQGNLVRLADNDITCTVLGNGHLLGLENGNMTDTTGALPTRGGNHRRAHQGHLVAYVQEGPAQMPFGTAFGRQQAPGRQQDADSMQRSPREQSHDIHVRVTSPLLQDAEITLTLPAEGR